MKLPRSSVRPSVRLAWIHAILGAFFSCFVNREHIKIRTGRIQHQLCRSFSHQVDFKVAPTTKFDVPSSKKRQSSVVSRSIFFEHDVREGKRVHITNSPFIICALGSTIVPLQKSLTESSGPDAVALHKT